MGKKVLIFASLLAFVSCSTSTPKEFNEALTAGIAKAENLVNSYDPVVLEAMEKNMPDSITSLSKRVLAELAKEQFNIKELASSEDEMRLKKAAEDYIGALINFVKSQNLYADYSDSLSQEEIRAIDKVCSDALVTVKMLRSKLTDYQNAFIKDKNIK
ncbi:MAG: hypothetical protein LBV74_09120 [Tannerella sp.]|nr:hypothetical protein [Tannerella sp.]